MKHEVIIRYEGQSTFIVDAETVGEATEKAKDRYSAGDDGDAGGDWETITSTQVWEFKP